MIAMRFLGMSYCSVGRTLLSDTGRKARSLLRRKDKVFPIFRISDQSRLQRIGPHVVDLLIVLLCIAYDTVEVFLLPHGAARSQELIDAACTDALERLHDVWQIVPDIHSLLQRLEKQVSVIG